MDQRSPRSRPRELAARICRPAPSRPRALRSRPGRRRRPSPTGGQPVRAPRRARPLAPTTTATGRRGSRSVLVAARCARGDPSSRLLVLSRRGGRRRSRVSPGARSQPRACRRIARGRRTELQPECHEAGRAISAARCLACHQPIADRMARKKGVHRAVTGDCAGATRSTRALTRTCAVSIGRHSTTRRKPGSRSTACTRSGRQLRRLPQDAQLPRPRAGLQLVPRRPAQRPLGRDCTKCHSHERSRSSRRASAVRSRPGTVSP